MYLRHIIAELFPEIAWLYERLMGKEFDRYKGNRLVNARICSSTLETSTE